MTQGSRPLLLFVSVCFFLSFYFISFSLGCPCFHFYLIFFCLKQVLIDNSMSFCPTGRMNKDFICASKPQAVYIHVKHQHHHRGLWTNVTQSKLDQSWWHGSSIPSAINNPRLSLWHFCATPLNYIEYCWLLAHVILSGCISRSWHFAQEHYSTGNDFLFLILSHLNKKRFTGHQIDRILFLFMRCLLIHAAYVEEMTVNLWYAVNSFQSCFSHKKNSPCTFRFSAIVGGSIWNWSCSRRIGSPTHYNCQSRNPMLKLKNKKIKIKVFSR